MKKLILSSVIILSVIAVSSGMAANSQHSSATVITVYNHADNDKTILISGDAAIYDIKPTNNNSPEHHTRTHHPHAHIKFTTAPRAGVMYDCNWAPGSDPTKPNMTINIESDTTCSIVNTSQKK